VILHLPNNLDYSRMAVVVSKKHGKAVVRNKIKRWARELFRRNKQLISQPRDIIFIPRQEIHQADWSMLLADYLQALKIINQNNVRQDLN